MKLKDLQSNNKALTKDEIVILELAAQGYNNKEIGNKLYISCHTVKSYLSVIMKKLNATDRTNAVYIAAKSGII